MIIEYLADNVSRVRTDDHDERNNPFAPGFLTRAYQGSRGQSLRDALGAARSESTMQHVKNAGDSQVRPYPAPHDYAPMDNRHAFAETRPSAPPRTRQGCRTCGRGDVNVNVNVATGTNSTSSSGARQDGTTEARGNAQEQQGPVPISVPSPYDVQPRADVSAELRRIVAEELQAVRPAITAGAQTTSQERPRFEQPKPKPDIVYRTVVIPRDRVVTKTVFKPFSVVWDRIKKVAVPRDVMHPIDRVKVRKVYTTNAKASFEGGARQAQGVGRTS